MAPTGPAAPVPVCGTCGEQHLTRFGKPACTGHRTGGYSRPEIRGTACTQRPMHGQDVCKSHGGNTPRARAAAEERIIAEQTRRSLAHYLDEAAQHGVDPGEYLVQLVYRAQAKVRFYTLLVGTLTEDQLGWGLTKHSTGGQNKGDTFEAKPHFWLTQLREAEQDARVVCVDALKMGVLQRELDLADKYAEKVMPILDAFMTEYGVDPSLPENAVKIERILRLVS